MKKFDLDGNLKIERLKIIIGGIDMERWMCILCGYVYDPEAGDPDSGVAPGTKWEDVPEDWICPLCAIGKDQFEKI